MQLRKAWTRFFICALIVFVLLCVVTVTVFYNTSTDREKDRANTTEEFIRNQRLDLIRNVVNNMISAIHIQQRETVAKAEADIAGITIILDELAKAGYSNDELTDRFFSVISELYDDVFLLCYNSESGNVTDTAGNSFQVSDVYAFEEIFSNCAIYEIYERNSGCRIGYGINKTTIYNDIAAAMQVYADSQVPLGDVDIRIDALNNYNLQGDFATRIVNPVFRAAGDTMINAENADYYDCFDMIIQNGEASTEIISDGNLDKIVYARLYRPYDWVISASVSAIDIRQLTAQLSEQSSRQQSDYIFAFMLMCALITAVAVVVFIIIGRLFFRTAHNEMKMIYDLSYVDALTEIRNRRYLDETLPHTISHLSRVDNGELSVLMIDVDDFKPYNDTYGHQKGDECLKTVAQTLAGALYRATDITIRYGGEEFAVILPYTDKAGALVVAEKLLDRVRELKIPHEAASAVPYVTLSIGVTTATVMHTHNYRDYIHKADEALYISKSNGRNRYTYLDY